jgi:uncharacterized phiE125 gp8 family phage protein
MLKPIRTVAPAATIISSTEAKAQADVTYSADDSLIGGLVNAVSELLDGYTGILGRCLVNQTWKVELSKWPADFMLHLPFPDVSSITSIKYWDSAGTQQTVSSDLYALHEGVAGSFVRFKEDFSAPNFDDDRANPIEVIFVAGFGSAASNVPAPIKTAALLLFSHLYENREATTPVAMTDLPLGVQMLLEPYRRRRL